MQRTWKPTVAGILEIVAGAVGLVAVIGLAIAIGVTGGFYIPGTEEIPRFVPFLLTGIAIPLAILSGPFLGRGLIRSAKKTVGVGTRGFNIGNILLDSDIGWSSRGNSGYDADRIVEE